MDSKIVNKVILVGNLGRDPEVHTASGGGVVISLSIATTRRVKKQDGSFGDETEWHRVVCFGKTAEVARDYLVKGRQVFIEGRLRTRKYNDKSGVEKYVTEILCESLKLIGRRDDAQPQQAPATHSSQKPATNYDDETPF